MYKEEEKESKESGSFKGMERMDGMPISPSGLTLPGTEGQGDYFGFFIKCICVWRGNV